MKVYQLEASASGRPYATLSIHATLDGAKEAVRREQNAYLPWNYVESLRQWEQLTRDTHYVITEVELQDATHQREIYALMVAALDVIGSISEKNYRSLRTPNGSMTNRLISPKSLISLSDALEKLKPGVVDRLYEEIKKGKP